MVDPKKRLIDLSYKHGLSHLGSGIATIDVIETIYKIKKAEDKFVLSNGHAGMALCAVLDCMGIRKVDKEPKVHPDRDEWIDCSTGSLGQGLPIALGMAIARRDLNVYCTISDGECAEGSIWEALRVGIEQNTSNLKVVLIANGYAAYRKVSLARLYRAIKGVGWNVVRVDAHDKKDLEKELLTERARPTLIFAEGKTIKPDFMRGLAAHYHVMNHEHYKVMKKWLKESQ